MKMKQNSLALPLLLVLACSHLSRAQHQSFIVRVVQFIPPNVDVNTFRCHSTIFTPNHVLTTASCATVLSPFAVACQHQEAIRAPDGTSVRIITEAVNRVFIHPNYIPGEDMVNNIAVLHLQDGWSTPIFLPRFLGGLESNRSDCSLYGWGEVNGHNRHSEAISIFNSTFCQPQFNQIFCTTFDAASQATCTALQGSPVTCGDEAVVAGILINNGTCSMSNNRAMLNYHSVHDFTDWIIETSGAEVTSKTSIVFILSAAAMCLMNVL